MTDMGWRLTDREVVMREMLFYGRLAFIVIAILVYSAAQLGFFTSSEESGPAGSRLILLDSGR